MPNVLVTTTSSLPARSLLRLRLGSGSGFGGFSSGFGEEEEEGSSPRPPAPEQHNLCWQATGFLSCAATREDTSSSSSFVVAQLEVEQLGDGQVSIHLFRSESGEWEVMKKMHVHGVTGRSDLFWWKTDAVVPYRHKFLIWVDYFRAMIVGDMSKSSPELRYVPLPVYSIPIFPEEPFADGRQCPEASRSVCPTRSGIKFVTIDTQKVSSFGLGHEEVEEHVQNHHVVVS